MWTKEKIADTFLEIVKELTEAAFDKDPLLRQEKLLGPAVGQGSCGAVKADRGYIWGIGPGRFYMRREF